MAKKILIAVGDCKYSRYAVKYVAAMGKGVNDLTYTLLNVQSVIPSILMQETKVNSECKADIEALIREGAETSRHVIGQLAECLVENGVPRNHIETLSEPMQVGMAKDIINQAERKGCNAIVIGSKGLTPTKDIFVGTTATKIVEHALKIPVWVVDEYAEPRDVLIAVDGSKNSLRVLDYVIAMIGENRDLSFVLFHVVPYLSHYYSVDFERKNLSLQKLIQERDYQRMEAFYSNAFQKFKKAGIEMNRVHTKMDKHGYDISTTILGEARRGQYGTVVVGRRGEREAFFTGRIAMRLFQKMPSPAVWMVA